MRRWQSEADLRGEAIARAFLRGVLAPAAGQGWHNAAVALAYRGVITG